MTSGIKGWKSRQARRAEEGLPFYRNAKSTVGKRYKKKLTEKSNWWREKRKLEDIDEEVDENSPKSSKANSGERSRITKRKDESKTNTIMIRSIMFVPYTWDGVLVNDSLYRCITMIFR